MRSVIITYATITLKYQVQSMFYLLFSVAFSNNPMALLILIRSRFYAKDTQAKLESCPITFEYSVHQYRINFTYL